MGFAFLAVFTGEGTGRPPGDRKRRQVKANTEPNGKMTKGELEKLLTAFRLNVKAAKTSIVSLGERLKAEFECNLIPPTHPMVIRSGKRNIRHY
jgi:hypothetical protein